MSKGNFVDNYIYGPHLSVGRMANNEMVNEQFLTQRMYMRVITELAANRFKWEGLPDEIDPRHLEMTLFRQALSVFFKASSENYGDRYFSLAGTGAGRIDPYDNPMKYQVTGNNFLNLTIKRKNCVPIFANYLRQPDWDIVSIFAAKLARITRSIDIAEMNMRNTNVIYATENTQLSAQNFIAQRDKGEMNIFTKKGSIQPEDLHVIDMKVHPDTLPKLLVAKSKYWNECMTLLGINNANQDKAERVQAAEVAANDQQVEATRRVALNAREQACEEINAKWPDLNVSVTYHLEEIQEPTLNMAEGNDNGNLYNETP